jgi:hypothetical protein
VQDWTTSNQFVDAPLKDATYKVKVRCSANPACASINGAVATSMVYTGDGDDVKIDLTHGVPVSTAVIGWTARPQLSSVDGYDLFRGELTAPAGDVALATLQCLQANIPQGVVGSPMSVQVGKFYYYLIGHSSKVAGAHDALGRRSAGTIRVAPIACP